ncbi:polysaccharide biosynthesis protein [Paenibacillus protaetiae]|uniref:Polysaccharide biosynthesis protein n=1 Tax=Paenibacillus protaetiae TaxID=2509456 RepID=A0A4P6F0Z2_9BACL|nr:nucleoside-diphosphate sugar epimerase/dehydratase [Paenibacillus protaetiae]QAY67779.1 polysaccharide biosynthesis protein [Paenibacillus protaetiae]
MYRRRAQSLFITDILIIWFSIVSSYFFRFHAGIPSDYKVQMFVYAVAMTVLCTCTFVYYRMYRRMWEYASIGEIVTLLKAVVAGSVLAFGAAWMIDAGRYVPLSIAARTIETMLLLMGGVRFAWRLIRIRLVDKRSTKNNVLIIGAGDCGALIAKEMMTPSFSGNRIVGFIDDDEYKQGMRVVGLPVFGTRSSIAEIVKAKDIHDIIIAMPSAPKAEISAIINICKLTNAKIKMIPAIHDFIKGRLSVKALRDVNVEDLLGRDPVMTDLVGIAEYVTDKIVLVTGAGGSIGSELCRQISSFQPRKLCLLGHGENSIYTIEMELRKKFPELVLETIIADIQDRSRLDHMFRVFKPEVVFHAAAHKHVPLMERNPAEAIKNNVFGTKNVADCADKYGAERFVMISSDKAVNPTSVMGATKRVAEMYIQSLNFVSKTKFVAVRFGNVLGSRGSVVPRFQEQIMNGGPVTVTHPDMIRYFMTIPEAVQLVIQAGSFANGGEIFILDMGKPVKILTLAEDLIRLSGYEPYADIPIEFTGIREGEKLFEELLTNEENITATQHNRIFIGKPISIDRSELDLELKRLEKVIGETPMLVKEVIQKVVPFHKQQISKTG